MFRVIFLSSQCKSKKSVGANGSGFICQPFSRFPSNLDCKFVKQAYNAKIFVQSGLGRKSF